MSKTPRTDEHILHHGNGNWYPSAFVLASFARQLETELAEARAEIERKDKLIEQMRAALEFLRETQGYKAVNGKDSKYIHMRSEAWSKCGFALDAAERARDEPQTHEKRTADRAKNKVARCCRERPRLHDSCWVKV